DRVVKASKHARAEVGEIFVLLHDYPRRDAHRLVLHPVDPASTAERAPTVELLEHSAGHGRALQRPKAVGRDGPFAGNCRHQYDLGLAWPGVAPVVRAGNRQSPGHGAIAVQGHELVVAGGDGTLQRVDLLRSAGKGVLEALGLATALCRREVDDPDAGHGILQDREAARRDVPGTTPAPAVPGEDPAARGGYLGQRPLHLVQDAVPVTPA